MESVSGHETKIQGGASANRTVPLTPPSSLQFLRCTALESLQSSLLNSGWSCIPIACPSKCTKRFLCKTGSDIHISDTMCSTGIVFQFAPPILQNPVIRYFVICYSSLFFPISSYSFSPLYIPTLLYYIILCYALRHCTMP